MIEMDDAAASAGELDEDFTDIEQEVLRRFPGISAQWRAPLEQAAGPHDMVLWERG